MHQEGGKGRICIQSPSKFSPLVIARFCAIKQKANRTSNMKVSELLNKEKTQSNPPCTLGELAPVSVGSFLMFDCYLQHFKSATNRKNGAI